MSLTANGTAGDILSANMGLTTCPESGGMGLDYPSTTVLCSVFTILAVAIAVLVAVRYNYLQWWLGDDIGAVQPQSWGIDFGDERLATLSNSYWIAFFVACGLRGVFESILFGVDSIHHQRHPVAVLQFAAWAMHAVTDFFLTLALYHQYFYRSKESEDEEEVDDASQQNWFYKNIRSMRAGFAGLAFLHTLCAWFSVPNLPDGDLQYDDPYWVLLASIALQRVPLYYFLAAVSFHIGSTVKPPTRASRVVLFLGAVIDVPSAIPFHILSKYILSDAINWRPCPLYVFSWLDLTIFLHGIALVHFLYFIQAEFIRVHEIEFYDCLQHYSENPAVDEE